ncbi:unnamed protein product [Sphacelaria rigidula]
MRYEIGRREGCWVIFDGIVHPRSAPNYFPVSSRVRFAGNHPLTRSTFTSNPTVSFPSKPLTQMHVPHPATSSLTLRTGPLKLDTASEAVPLARSTAAEAVARLHERLRSCGVFCVRCQLNWFLGRHELVGRSIPRWMYKAHGTMQRGGRYLRALEIEIRRHCTILPLLCAPNLKIS